jgi:hypothetical protein
MTLEIKINDSFVPLEFVPNSAKIELEWALINNAEMTLNCYKCHTPITNGIGSYCLDCKKVNLKTCQICELAHEGLYCTNCFTGERIRVGKTKFAKVIRLHEIKVFA